MLLSATKTRGAWGKSGESLEFQGIRQRDRINATMSRNHVISPRLRQAGWLAGMKTDSINRLRGISPEFSAGKARMCGKTISQRATAELETWEIELIAGEKLRV